MRIVLSVRRFRWAPIIPSLSNPWSGLFLWHWAKHDPLKHIFLELVWQVFSTVQRATFAKFCKSQGLVQAHSLSRLLPYNELRRRRWPSPAGACKKSNWELEEGWCSIETLACSKQSTDVAAARNIMVRFTPVPKEFFAMSTEATKRYTGSSSTPQGIKMSVTNNDMFTVRAWKEDNSAADWKTRTLKRRSLSHVNSRARSNKVVLNTKTPGFNVTSYSNTEYPFNVSVMRLEKVNRRFSGYAIMLAPFVKCPVNASAFIMVGSALSSWAGSAGWARVSIMTLVKKLNKSVDAKKGWSRGRRGWLA